MAETALRTRTQLIQGAPGPPGLQFPNALVVNELFGPDANPAPNQAVLVDTTVATGVSGATVNLPAPDAAEGEAAFDGCYVVVVDFYGNASTRPITVVAQGHTVGTGLVPAGTAVKIAWPLGESPATPQASISLDDQGVSLWLFYNATLGLWVPGAPGTPGAQGPPGALLGSVAIGTTPINVLEVVYDVVVCPANTTTTVWSLAAKFPPANLAVGELIRLNVDVTIDATNAQGHAVFIQTIEVKNDPTLGPVSTAGGSSDIDLSQPPSPSNVAASIPGVSCAIVVSGSTLLLQVTMPSGVAGNAVVAVSGRRFQGNPTIYTPPFPTAGIVADWNADNAPNSGGHVSGSWLDAITGAVLTPTSSPAWAAAQIGTHAAVTTDGAASYLTNTTLAQAQPNEVWFVMKQVTWNNSSAGYIFASDSGNVVISQAGTTPQIAFYAGSTQDGNNGGAAVGSWAIVRVVFNAAGTSEIQINNGSPVTGTPGALALSSGFTLGAQPGGGLFSNCSFSRILVVDPTAGGYSAAALYAGLIAEGY